MGNSSLGPKVKIGDFLFKNLKFNEFRSFFSKQIFVDVGHIRCRILKTTREGLVECFLSCGYGSDEGCLKLFMAFGNGRLYKGRR
jgi:hypothetical protein